MNLASCLKFLLQNGDFGGGFLVLGCFSPVFNILGLFFMFGFGLKLLHFTKKTYSEPSSAKSLQDSRFKEKGFSNDEVNDNNGECDQSEVGVEDEEYDLLKLRKLVKIERHRANRAHTEVEKERMASATSASEAMSMILRLQNEKSSLEIEANQYRRLAEQKHEYDQEIIQSLQWIIMKYETEKCVLQEKLELCRYNMIRYLECDEMEQFDASLNLVESKFCDFNLNEDHFEDGLHQFDMDSSISIGNDCNLLENLRKVGGIAWSLHNRSLLKAAEREALKDADSNSFVLKIAPY